ncbi:MAG: extracellular solute-binding protein [Chloroflexi bacterium]|nr:extracellular solute-binding protein [Chloroflexota bacterium]
MKSFVSRRTCLRSIVASSVGLATTMLLAACGGPAATATTATVTQTVTKARVSTATVARTSVSTATVTSVKATTVTATAPAKAKTPVEFWLWYPVTLFEGWAKAFNAKSSDIQVTVTNPAGKYYTKITAAEAGGTGPDAFLSDSDGFKNRAFAGLEGSIADLVSQDKMVGANLKQMLPAAVQWYRYNGKQYGLPWDYSAGVVVYNVNQLRSVGLTLPAELSVDPTKWTWTTLQQYAARLTVIKGGTVDRIGALISWSGYENSWYSLALANGGSYFNASFDQCTIASPEAVAALDFVAELAKRNVIATPTSWKTIASQYKRPMEPFTAGKVAIQYTGDWNFKHIEQAKSGVTWDATILPYDPKTGKTGNWSNLRGLVMSPSAKHREAAFQFLAYFTTAEVQDTITATLAEVPMRLDSAAKTYLLPKVGGPPPGRTTLKPALEATVTLGSPYVTEDDTWNLLSKATESVYEGKSTAKDALTALQAQINGKIKAGMATNG